MANTIAINVVADVKRAVASLDSVERKLGGFGKSASRIGGLVKGALAGAAVVGGASIVKQKFDEITTAASNLQQSTGAMDAVFGKSAGTMKKYGDSAAQSLGLSKNSYQELATVLGAGLKNQGIKDFAGETNKVIGLGADLAAQFGGSTKDAVEAIGSLMRGEADPIERYGVTIKQSAINAELAKQGLSGLTGAAKTQAEAQARLKLLFEQTGSAQGAFSREANTLANIQQRNAAASENLKAKLGTILLPVLTQLYGFVGEKVLPAVSKFADYLSANLPAAITAVTPFVKQLGNFLTTVIGPALKSAAQFIVANLPAALSALGTALAFVKAVLSVVVPAVSAFLGFLSRHKALVTGVAVSLGVLVAGYKAIQLVQAVMAAGGFLKFILGIAKATKTWAVVQGVLNVVMAANPIALVVIAIAALVAGVIVAYKNSEKFRAIVDKAFKGIKAAGVAVFNFLKSFIPAAIKTVVTVSTFQVRLMWTVIKGVWNLLKAGTRAAINLFKSYVINPIKSIPGLVKGFLESMRSGAASKFDSLKADAQAKFTQIKNSIINAVQVLPGRVRAYFESLRSGAVEKVNALIAKVRGIKSSILNALANIGSWLYNAGKNLISGFINGISGSLGAVIDKAKSIARAAVDAAKGALGINSPSRVFEKIGKQTGQGLIRGLDNARSGVRSSISGLATTMERAFDPNLAVSMSAAGMSPAASSGNTYITLQVEVSPFANPVEIGREIENTLNAYHRAAGKR